MRECTVILCHEKKATDEIGQTVNISMVKNEVFARIGSISQGEFFTAAQSGITPKFKVEVFEFDYNGENLIQIDGNMYKIYRTFTRVDEQIELYCEVATGVVR